jgi:superfamily I DNA and/or RNA helicase
MSQDLVYQTIKKFQDKLLDLSARNKLLNFKFSEKARTQIRIINDSSDRIFQRLSDGKRLGLQTLPEPDSTPPDENTEQFQQMLIEMRSTDEQYQNAIAGDDESPEQTQASERLLRNKVRAKLNLPKLLSSKVSPTPQQQAQGLGINPAYDLPSFASEGMSSKLILQTLLFPKEFERKASGLLTGARTSLQETGLNTLFLSFGMLEWFESESSNVRFISPLLLYPVSIERESVSGQYRYFIKAFEDEVEVNPCLRERLQRDFGIKLPDFGEETITAKTPDVYFQEVRKLTTGMNRWQVRQSVTLSLFSFGNFSLYKDLTPENWANDSLVKNPIVSSLLGGSNAERSDNFRIPSDYDVDKPEISKKVPLIISETDASQFSAIVDVMDGKNLVIEGPPGTGKSQTITNLIAAALAKGKKVLFVAEKMAAVEVVRDRLKAVGLGEFCLEIHSTNKPKSEVYKEIKARYELVNDEEATSFGDIEREYIKNRQKLTDYVQLLNQPFGKMGDENKIHTIQEILWRAKSLQQKFKSINIPDNLLALSIANAQYISRFEFENHLTLLKKFIRVQIEIEQANQDVSIWEGISALDLDPIEQDQLIRDFSQLNKTISEALNLYQIQASIFELPDNPTLGNLKSLDDLILQIPDLPPQIEIALLVSLRSPSSILICREFIEKYSENKQLLKKASQFFDDGNREVSNLEKIQEFASKLHCIKKERQLNQEWITQPIKTQVHQLWSDNRNHLEQWQSILPAFKFLQNLLELKQDLLIGDISNIANIFQFVESTPEHILRYRNAKLCNPASFNILTKAESLQKKYIFLNNAVHLDRCNDSQKLRYCAKRIISAGIFFFIDGEYTKAHQLWKNIKNFAKVNSDQEISNLMIQVADFWDEYAVLKDRDGIDLICGKLYRDFETDYKTCYAINNFGRRLEEVIVGLSCKDKIRDFIIKSSLESLKDAITYTSSSDFQELQKICHNLISNGFSSISSLSSTSIVLEERKQEIERIYQNLLELKLRSDLSLQELPSLMLEMHNYKRSQEDLNSPLFTSILGTYPQSETFSIESLQGCLDWSEAIHKVQFPQNIKQQCLSPNATKFITSIRDFASRYHHLIQEKEHYLQTVMPLGKIDCFVMFGDLKISNCKIIKVQARLQELNQVVALQRYLNYKKVKSEINLVNLSNFIDLSSVSDLSKEQIDFLYRVVFYRSLVSEIHKKYNNIRLFEGQDQQIARQNFQQLDREMLKLYQGKLITQLAQNQIPEGNGRGRKDTWTEQSLIKNEITKQKKLAPLRELFKRAGNSLQALQPCWMMSPASVAQLLPSNTIRFDLVVIDEASQMRPEEALGVIARGKQLIVVGDPKQLPPSNFFRAADQVEESEDVDSETLEEESILDMAMKNFSVRRLKWHYRSRHESLIAFSNKHFYDNTLTIFPSPHRKFAINYHHIAEGIYQSGVNPLEVRRVAEAIVEFMRNTPDQSLGVVTLNQKQRDLLQDEISLLVNTHPEVANYIAKWEETLSPFFIKNLENVQGDERDVIFISTVYGRERSDLPVAQRFGPINSASGHRRLNVLFTRAKERIEVFSSMTAADIRPTESSNRGVHALKNYLEYIQTQQLETARLTGREPDSDFEVFVAKAIRAKGFEVVAQVGVANYFIDLAIVDPHQSGTYLLGIECDGATYHSSKAARDRDRYRQEVLEKLGWKLYRIWSTDWFKNPDAEIEKLVKYVNEIMRPAITFP